MGVKIRHAHLAIPSTIRRSPIQSNMTSTLSSILFAPTLFLQNCHTSSLSLTTRKMSKNIRKLCVQTKLFGTSLFLSRTDGNAIGQCIMLSTATMKPSRISGDCESEADVSCRTFHTNGRWIMKRA